MKNNVETIREIVDALISGDQPLAYHGIIFSWMNSIENRKLLDEIRKIPGRDCTSMTLAQKLAMISTMREEHSDDDLCAAFEVPIEALQRYIHSLKQRPTCHGNKREALVSEIRREMGIPTTATRQERLQAVYGYSQKHPEYSGRILCLAGEVDQGTYRHFIKTGATGNNGREAHRRIIVEALKDFRDKTGCALTIGNAMDELKRRGIKCSRYIVRDILEEAGYATSVMSINNLDNLIKSLPNLV